MNTSGVPGVATHRLAGTGAAAGPGVAIPTADARPTKYPGRESNPQCSDERTAFKAADFAVCPPGRVFGADRTAALKESGRGAEKCREGNRPLARLPSRHQPVARPAPRLAVARVVLPVRARHRRAVAVRPARRAPPYPPARGGLRPGAAAG